MGCRTLQTRTNPGRHIYSYHAGDLYDVTFGRVFVFLLSLGITADALTGDMFQHRWDLERFEQWQNAGTHEDTQQAYHFGLKAVCDVVFGKNPVEGMKV